MKITYNEVAKQLSYDAQIGVFRWKNTVYGGFKKSVLIHKAGDVAGCIRKDGRRVIRVCGKLFMAYRLAWLLHYGEWPKDEIDHINSISSDDRIANLRDVGRAINQQNQRRAYSRKKGSALLGVYTNKKGRKLPWRAMISSNGRQVYLGAFATEEAAYEAYLSAKRSMHLGCTL